MLDLAAYKMHLIENEIRINTIKNYMNTLGQLDKFLTDNNFDLSKENVILFKDFMRTTEYSKGKYYKTKTVNQKITAINIYFNWLDRKELCLKLVNNQTDSHRESIDRNEYRKLLKTASKEMYLFMLTVANTGLRITELCQLKVADLDSKLQYIENKGKIRYISIPVFVKKQLKKYSLDNGIEETIFYKNQATYRTNLKSIAGRAKVRKDKVYPHSFRHYFAKEFIKNGGDATELQQMLGHENISTTTIYTKYNPNELGERFRSIKNI
ncbi:integrase [Listeria monocytogenes]|uniref:tyrosine-type recombinase/integrase n=1 Tax=Candidatus Enterococcus huntleyi TaxID=1857217 RepID=UPI00137B4370|nr:tyrosine-type recombinase/integrase [Enterococcus sp. JM4C]EAF6235998.1 integrase [Listeria monocytogenes]KAF1295158.1 integrase [Enterococcus sp. JM4C]